MRLREALAEGRRMLAAVSPDEAELEAEILLRHALKIDRVNLYERLTDTVPEAEYDDYVRLLARRVARDPVAYITGHREFFGLEFEVSPAVLIPRPETETLVELAVAFARGRPQPPLIADVGTGSGAIAVALAVTLADARIVATDNSAAALAVARRNAERHGVADRVAFVECDLLVPASESARYDLIAANLPYVRTADWLIAPPEIREHEPRAALDGGRDGLDVIRRLLTLASQQLAAGGALLCEIGADQRGEAAAAARAAFPDARVEVQPDLAGRDRVLAVYAAPGA